MRIETDEELMVAYANGDESAFDVLFARYAPLLLRVMRSHVQRRQDAAHLVQQTFLHLHQARNDYHQGNRLRPWLMMIAFNLKRDYLHAGKGRPEVSTDHEPWRAAIDELPDAQREVIMMHWLGELSFSEIAFIVGSTVSAVKVRAQRGYKTLRALLDRSAAAA